MTGFTNDGCAILFDISYGVLLETRERDASTECWEGKAAAA